MGRERKRERKSGKFLLRGGEIHEVKVKERKGDSK